MDMEYNPETDTFEVVERQLITTKLRVDEPAPALAILTLAVREVIRETQRRGGAIDASTFMLEEGHDHGFGVDWVQASAETTRSPR